nr:MAG TPA: hypothetical protein [Caudoviricetes sp.]
MEILELLEYIVIVKTLEVIRYLIMEVLVKVKLEV